MTGRATVVDLFAGCGGGSLGFRQAGFEVIGAVEIDQDAATAYEANVGVAPLVKDIRKVSGRTLLAGTGVEAGECTLLFGCPPCQSFTILRRGAAEPPRTAPATPFRTSTCDLPTYLPATHRIRERSRNLGPQVATPVRRAARELCSDLGYRCRWDVLDAADFGVPQRRGACSSSAAGWPSLHSRRPRTELPARTACRPTGPCARQSVRCGP